MTAPKWILSLLFMVFLSSGTALVAKKPSQCAAFDLQNDQAPVMAPLTRILGGNLTSGLRTFLLETPLGRILAPPSASICIANMNGTMLGNTILQNLATPVCGSLVNMTRIPFVEKALAMAMAPSNGEPVSVQAFGTWLASISNAEIQSFCGLYTANVVPCISHQLFPQLAIVREKHSRGCCETWVNETVSGYGLSISGLVTKLAQAAGNLICSTEMKPEGQEEERTCGFTLLQTALKQTNKALGDVLVQSLEVPNDQACAMADGHAYEDINGYDFDAMPSEAPVPSGCVTGIDRFGSWLKKLPVLSHSEVLSSLFHTDECVNGSALFEKISPFLPTALHQAMGDRMKKAPCLHWPTQFADTCNFTRPVQVVQWASDASGPAGASSSSSSQAHDTLVAMETNAPSPSPHQTSAAAISTKSLELMHVLLSVVVFNWIG